MYGIFTYRLIYSIRNNIVTMLFFCCHILYYICHINQISKLLYRMKRANFIFHNPRTARGHNTAMCFGLVIKKVQSDPWGAVYNTLLLSVYYTAYTVGLQLAQFTHIIIHMCLPMDKLAHPFIFFNDKLLSHFEFLVSMCIILVFIIYIYI